MPQVTRGPTPFPMQYQVLARKWRPQNFHEIVGQEHVSRTLVNGLKTGRVAHAFLFSGPRGSGKTTTARVLAKALNCHAGQPGEPCGKCVACTEIAAGNCMDVLEIDAASNTGVDNVRSLIEQVQYNPARDRNKIFIIDEVHMLSNQAFNALLKTLEEPPPRVVFIMATTEYHKIPATILSRCQQHGFKLLPFPLILDRLRMIAREEKIQVSTVALEQVAFSSGGSMRDAMSALDQVIAFSGNTVRDEDVTMLLGLVEPIILGDTVRAIAGNDIESLLKLVAGFVDAGQDLQNFCRRLLSHFRNLMVLKAGVADPVLLGVPESQVPDLREQAGLFSREDLLRLFEAFLKIETDLKHATQVRFGLEMGLIELAHVSRMRSLEDLITEFQSVVGGGSPSAAAALPAESPAAAVRKAEPAPVRPARPTVSPPIPGRAFPAPSDPAPVAPAHPLRSNKAAEPDVASRSSIDLLWRIAQAVKKESLESLLQSLGGAVVADDRVILDPGSSGEFVRRQVSDNLALVAQAASEVLGRLVRVQIGSIQAAGRIPDPGIPSEPPASPPAPATQRPDPLERAKREPVVLSFMDEFPGPVKAEDLEQ